eukprot:scaffold1222_cov138-Isochrysis_galbana.AAC.2
MTWTIIAGSPNWEGTGKIFCLREDLRLPHIKCSVTTLQRLWAPTSKVKEFSIAGGKCNLLFQQTESVKQLNR